MKCGYIRQTWDCGNTREVEEKHTGRYGARGQKRQKRRKATPEEIAKQNQWKRERDVRRLIKWNFGIGDYWFTLTYKKGSRPPWKQMQKDMSKFIRKLRDKYKKYGWELKYIYRLEIGKNGGPHVHILINRKSTGPDLVVQRIPGSRYGWSYCRWSNPIRKNNQHVFIIRYVGHEYLHWPELCHVRKDHRILPEKCSVLAETDAPVKRIFHHGSQGRQPSDHPKRRKRKLLLHIRRQG